MSQAQHLNSSVQSWAGGKHRLMSHEPPLGWASLPEGAAVCGQTRGPAGGWGTCSPVTELNSRVSCKCKILAHVPEILFNSSMNGGTSSELKGAWTITHASAIRSAGVNVHTGAKLLHSHRAISKCLCAGYNSFVFL